LQLRAQPYNRPRSASQTLTAEARRHRRSTEITEFEISNFKFLSAASVPSVSPWLILTALMLKRESERRSLTERRDVKSRHARADAAGDLVGERAGRPRDLFRRDFELAVNAEQSHALAHRHAGHVGHVHQRQVHRDAPHHG